MAGVTLNAKGTSVSSFKIGKSTGLTLTQTGEINSPPATDLTLSVDSGNFFILKANTGASVTLKANGSQDLIINPPGAGALTLVENIWPATDGTTGQILQTDGAGALSWVSPTGTGTVTSVAASGSNGVSISGSPITTSGTITIGLGAITPTSVAATGTVTGSNLSGVNTGNQTIVLSGDLTGSGTDSLTATLVTVNSSPQADTFRKITVNGKGLVTATSAVSSSDVTTALGYTPVNKAGDTMTGDLTIDSGVATTPSRVVQTTYASNSAILHRRANGTLASPSAVSLANILGFWGAQGYGATGFAASSSVSIAFKAAENWTNSANGSIIEFAVTPNGSSTKAAAFTIGNAGQLGIGAGVSNGTAGQVLTSGGPNAAPSWASSASNTITADDALIYSLTF